MAKKKRKYYRPFPNNPKLDILDKRIPFPLSIKRNIVIEFKATCKGLGLSHNDIAEELMKGFLVDLKKK